MAEHWKWHVPLSGQKIFYLFNELLNTLTLWHIEQFILAEIFLLLALVAVIIILASPEFAPQLFNGAKFQIQNGIQKCFAMFTIYRSKRIDILQCHIIGQWMIDFDLWENRNGTVTVAQILKTKTLDALPIQPNCPFKHIPVSKPHTSPVCCPFFERDSTCYYPNYCYWCDCSNWSHCSSADRPWPSSAMNRVSPECHNSDILNCHACPNAASAVPWIRNELICRNWLHLQRRVCVRCSDACSDCKAWIGADLHLRPSHNYRLAKQPFNIFWMKTIVDNTSILYKLTVAGDTRVACVRLGVPSDSELVGVVGVVCWIYVTSYCRGNILFNKKVQSIWSPIKLPR